MSGDSLFAIDVASEIRSLCESQLRGTWQMPAELVRFAVRSGAREIAVSGGWLGYSFGWRHGPIGDPTLTRLAIALDDAADPVLRQESIANLESSGAEALFWAGGLAGSRLSIDEAAGGRHVRFTRIAGRASRLRRSMGSDLRDGVRLDWKCSKLDRRRADMWLRMACRFSDADVTVDGRAAPKGFAGGLYRMCLEDRVPCTLGLTRHGEEPVLWLLRDGIVAARATVPGYPPFEAAVELGGVISGAASGSDLRRVVRPYMSELCDRAVDMMIDVAGRPRRVFGPDGQRFIALLLRAVRRDLRTGDIVAMPLIPTLDHETPPLSTARLEAMARRSGGRSFAVAPDEAGDDVLADPSSIVVVSPEVRNLLTELAGIRFQPPPRRRLDLVQRLGDTSRRAVRRFLERLRGALRPQIAAPDVLSSGERRVLTGLRAALSPRTVDLGDCRHLRRTATGLVVPRLDSSVAAAASWSDENGGWLYPLILVLKLDDPSPESARTSWALGVADHPTSPPIGSPTDGPDGVERP